MSLPIPAAKKPVKVDLTAGQVSDLEKIGKQHYDEHRTAYEDAKKDQPTAGEVASYLLDEAIRRELKPSRKKPNGR